MKKRSISYLPAAIAVFTLFSLISCREVYVDEAEQFIKTDASVQSRVGEVRSLSRGRTIVVNDGILNTGEASPAYHEYHFIVRGSRSEASVSVSVKAPYDPAKRSFSINWIDDLR
jgi:hypothetical protein